MKNFIYLLFFVMLWSPSADAQHTTPNYICINEVKTIGENGPYDEFIELFNVSDSLFDMSGYMLLQFNRDGLPYFHPEEVLLDGQTHRVLYRFPDSTFIKPFHYFLLVTDLCSEKKKADGIMGGDLLSDAQIILANATLTDTLDAVAWGRILVNVTNEGQPVRYLEPRKGPPVSPNPLAPDSARSIQRFPEGHDTNNNLADFQMRHFTTAMNSSDSLKLVIDSSFRAAYVAADKIFISWQTLSLTRDFSFEIMHCSESNRAWHTLATHTAIAHVCKNDTNFFNGLHENVTADVVHFYQVKERDLAGRERLTRTEAVKPQNAENAVTLNQPRLFTLKQNYPNPFNPQTSIDFSLDKRCRVILAIYSLSGEPIRILEQREKEMGDQRVFWDGKNEAGSRVPSGTYFYQLRVNEKQQQTKKMVLIH